MKSLILPIAGKSSRFPEMRPKWMLTHPNGNLMIVEAVKGFEPGFFDQVYVVALKEHEDQYHVCEVVQSELGFLKARVKIVLLEQPTASQPETVSQCLAREKVEGFFYIKDCDNYFATSITAENCISYYDVQTMTEVNAGNKSYVKMNSQGIVENIVEKKIISSLFCCGGYGFSNVEEFQEAFLKLRQIKTDIYISDIIFELILNGGIFRGIGAKDYIDWGTQADWNKYAASFRTIFIDLDGCILKNSAEHFSPKIGETPGLEKSIQALNALDPVKTHVIITTSRKEKYREVTERQLKELGVRYNLLLMGLPHCKRVLVNDFSKTNPYPSALAINVPRDGNNLGEYLV